MAPTHAPLEPPQTGNAETPPPPFIVQQAVRVLARAGGTGISLRIVIENRLEMVQGAQGSRLLNEPPV